MLNSIPDEKRKCHRCSFEKSCRDLVLSGACDRWMSIDGQNPQTGEIIHRWACTDDHIPMLLLEIGRQTMQAGAAVESMRNESAKQHDESKTMAAIAVQRSRDAVREAIFDRLPEPLQNGMKLIGN